MFLGQTPQTSEFQANNNELEKQQKRLQDLQKQVDLLKKTYRRLILSMTRKRNAVATLFMKIKNSIVNF